MHITNVQSTGANSMNFPLAQTVKTALLKQNLLLTRPTAKQKIIEFIASVRPVRTNRSLIRLGGSGDGGYLVPDDLEGISTCFSPGVSEIATFEENLAKRGVKCFLADYSVDAPPVENPLFDFEKRYLGPSETDVFMTLENWIQRRAPQETDMILQMDIEGAEYGVIFNTSVDTFRKFRIIVIEFHKLDALVEKMGYELIRLAFTKLLEAFSVVHIHPNNTCKPLYYQGLSIPPILEFTFLRNDRITTTEPVMEFPHRLDCPCVPSVKDFALPRCWY